MASTVGVVVAAEVENAVRGAMGPDGAPAMLETLRKIVDPDVASVVEDELLNAMEFTVGEAVEDSMGPGVTSTVEDAILEAVQEAVRETVHPDAASAVEEEVLEIVEEALSEAVSYAVRKAVGEAVGLFVGLPVFGAALGIAQWLVLRRGVSRAGWWVLASTVAFAVAGFLAPPKDDRVFFIATGSIDGVGLVVSLAGYGAITGAVMVWLLRQPVTDEPGLPQDGA